MISIRREDMPAECPHCGGLLKSYHSAGVTRRVCMERCNGYEVVVQIDHNAEQRGDPAAIKMMAH